jgi:hypothetical protein
VRARRLAAAILLLGSCGACAEEVRSEPGARATGLTAPFDPNRPEASGMVLSFADEFDEASISVDGRRLSTRWTDHLWYEKPLPGGTATAQGGVLTLRGNGGYGIATVNERGEGFAQRFGYFEARIQIPCGKGTWPAFWLISNDRVTKSPNLPASELDILEGQGVEPNGYFKTIHRDSARKDREETNKDVFTGDLGVRLCRDFHRYGLYWPPDEDRVTWYFDGQSVGSAAKFDTTDLAPMMMILGNGYGDMIGHNQPDALTPRPSKMLVDYVRTWQFPAQGLHQCIGDCRSVGPRRAPPAR